MNKLFLVLITVLLLPAVFAEGYPVTVVNGVVYSGETIKTPPVTGVEIVVYCLDSYQTDMTDAQGAFEVVFQDNECPIGHEIMACAGEICHSKANNGLTSRFQLTEVKLFRIPEFGMIAGALAGIGSIAAYSFMRKR